MAHTAKHRRNLVMNMHNRPRPLRAQPGPWELLWTATAIAAGILVLWFILHGGNTRAEEPPVVDDPLATVLGVECRQFPDGHWWLTGPNPLPCGPSTLPPVTPGHVDANGCTPAVPSYNCPHDQPATVAALDVVEGRCESCGTDTTPPTTAPETTWPPASTVPASTTSVTPTVETTTPPSSSTSTSTTTSSTPETSSPTSPQPTTTSPAPSSVVSVAPPPTVAPWTTDPCSTDGIWTRNYLYPCPTTTTVAPAQQLPTTGMSGPLWALALAATVAGAMLAAVARRRPAGES
jgi:hypothetical protein